MKRFVFGLAMSAAAGLLIAAQLYRWVDDKGNVEYRDTPPPQSAKKVEERRVRASTIESPVVPYDVQVATKNYPVTLWAYDCGEPCKNARAHLERRGVPFSEKDPRGDLAAFEKLTGSTGVPVLYVGSTKLTGYLESSWDTTLDSAGYPKTAPAGAAKAAPKPPAKAADAKGAAGEKPAEPNPDVQAAPPPPAATAERGPGKK